MHSASPSLSVVHTAKTRTFQKASYQTFLDAMSVLGLTEDELCLELGYTSATSWRSWAKDDEMPLVASKLCKAMIKAKMAVQTATYLVKTTNPAAEAFVLNALNFHPPGVEWIKLDF